MYQKLIQTRLVFHENLMQCIWQANFGQNYIFESRYKLCFHFILFRTECQSLDKISQ
jgi:hypothetical protein